MKISLKADKETILKLLKDSEINKKLKIFDKLGELNEVERAKILLKILEDGSWCLREKSAYELAKLGNKVVPRLVKLCRHGHWFSRSAASLSLGEIGDLKALHPLVNLLLKDDNPTVIKEAKTALIKMAQKDPPKFLAQLNIILTDEGERNKILQIIEESAPEIYSKIKEAMTKNG